MNTKRLSITALFLSFLAFTAMTSCGDDNDNNSKTGQKEELTNNKNSNLKEAQYATHRLEFPKLKGGKSVIITHKLNNGEVNYSVEWDAELKSNRWTCYQLYSSNRQNNVARKTYDSPNLYPIDPMFPIAGYYETDHYTGTGYDHGHLCPSADRLNTREANDQTFYLSNMQPQLKAFNGSAKGGGIWLTMENRMRNFISIGSTDTLFVCRGGTIDNPKMIKEYRRDKFIVPGYFFSTALLKYKVRGQGDWQYKAIGFWFRHENNQASSLKPYVVNIDRLEELTGIDFFCNLPDDIETKVESVPVNTVITLWNIQ
ncbi:MAG: DNA/RNA non-specific endonuclease [Prevotella sp.]|nr:DNA/RNA non-specific endonuclease [Prevotella sp.]